MAGVYLLFLLLSFRPSNSLPLSLFIMELFNYALCSCILPVNVSWYQFSFAILKTGNQAVKIRLQFYGPRG